MNGLLFGDDPRAAAATMGLLGMGSALLTPVNQGGGFGGAGRAAQQALLFQQQMQRQQQHDAMQREMFGMQRQQFELEQQAAQARQAALAQVGDEIARTRPDMLPAFRVDPVGTVKQLYGAQAPIKLGEGDRLYDPRTFQQVAENPKSPELPGDVRALEYITGRPLAGTGPQGVAALHDYRRSGATNVNVGGATPGQTEADKRYASEFVVWTAGGGFADTQMMLRELEGAHKALTTEKNISGPDVAIVDKAGALSLVNPRAKAVMDSVHTVAQRNLRLILGAQFTEKEGAAFLARVYDPAQPQSENARRVRVLMDQIRDAATAKQDAAEYFNQHGTLRGFRGQLYRNMGQFLYEYEKRVNQGRPDAASAPTKPPQESRVINGKTYIKIDGQWFEQ